MSQICNFRAWQDGERKKASSSTFGLFKLSVLAALLTAIRQWLMFRFPAVFCFSGLVDGLLLIVWPIYESLSINDAQAVPKKVNHKAVFVKSRAQPGLRRPACAIR